MVNAYLLAGVNTGFGGSADSRTKELFTLQSALMQLTQAGIMGSMTGGTAPEHTMPSSWVRATILVRCNATIRGHSAVSLPVLEAIISLLKHRLTPIVPLRGSISVSGDLMPLSYIAGAIEGNPGIYVQLDNKKVVTADEALQITGITPVNLGPKEGLGLVNGTACSAALAALVVNDSHRLALMTQALTAMAVEVSDEMLTALLKITHHFNRRY